MFNSGKYHFKWFHDNQHSNNFQGSAKLSYRHPTKPKPSVTTCEIWEMNKLVSTGSAICKPEDNFSKLEGRKRSMRRSLLNGLPREERTKIWADYLKKWPPAPKK